MFCPKCGCLLPEGSTVCKECGCRIERSVRDSLDEVQPTDKGVRTEMSRTAKKHGAEVTFGIFLCAVLTLSVFTEWLSSPDYAGFQLLADQPYLGHNSWVLDIVPLFVILSGMICALVLATGYNDAVLTFPFGIVSVALVLVFCLCAERYTPCDIGFGIYIALLAAFVLAMMGLRRIQNQ